MKKRWPWPPGWTIAWILLGLYLILKLQGWWFGFQAAALEKELKGLRPAISQIVLGEQLKTSCINCTQALDEIRATDLDGALRLEQLSKNLRPSVTLEELELHPMLGSRLWGVVLPGSRSPEKSIHPWASSLRRAQVDVEIRDLVLDKKVPRLWHFEVKAEKASHD